MKQSLLLLCLCAWMMRSEGQVRSGASGMSALDSNAVRVLFFAGLREKLHDNFQKAGEDFQKILDIDPGSAPAYYELAAMYYRLNKLPDSEGAIKKAISLERDNIWYWKLLAELNKRKGDMNALIEVFGEMIRIAPETDAFYFDRSNAYLLSGRPEEAAKGYDEIESKFGQSEALFQARKRLKMEEGVLPGKEQIESMLKDEGGDLKELLYNSGLLMEKNQHEAALALLRKAKGMAGENFEVDLALADVYKASKNDAEAVNALRRAFADQAMPVEEKTKIVAMLLSGQKPGAQDQRGGSPQFDDARELAEIIIKTNPEAAEAHALYGDILYQEGSLQASLNEYQAALKLSDDLFKAWERVLRIQNRLGQYAETVKAADQALMIFPNQGLLYFDLAVALLKQNRYAEAEKEIEAALQLDEDNPLYLECLGDILFLKGDQAGALLRWKAAKAAGNESEKLTKKIHEKKYNP